MGNASCAACPLKVDDRTVGALAIFAPEPDNFGAEELPLLCESADDLAFGIATLRASAERSKAERAVHHLTHFDRLTGLPNETSFTESLAAALVEASARGEHLALLQTNIERLSDINDALGFAHGDQLLRDFAERLRRVFPTVIAARMRGDEFAVLLPGLDAASAMEQVRLLEYAVATPFALADIQVEVSMRTGIAVSPEHGVVPHDLLRHTGIAMHDAKKRGLLHAVFDPGQDLDKPRRLGMAGELRRAIEGGDLRVFLQPKIEMATGRVCGSEALVRWEHADRGLIPPGQFIELAETTGLIKPLTEWMIESVINVNRSWSQRGCALPIAVNLSARNLHDDELIRKIKLWGGPAALLELEITESAVMEDAKFALRVLHALRDEGIVLYVDDFGTGYSSLSYLQKLPVDYIKIDQSFVQDMSTNKDSAMIVRSTVDLVHDLGRLVVAEGVETQDSWNQLLQLGCDVAQGYFIAKPMPAAAFPDWLKEHDRRQFHPLEPTC
jgi:diguanylate cyclase (GGDEF)-like protein